jgi:hypothetical protein
MDRMPVRRMHNLQEEEKHRNDSPQTWFQAADHCLAHISIFIYYIHHFALRLG